MAEPENIAPAEKEHAHPGAKEYLGIAVVLTVITAIEVLSPTNETREHDGRALYLQKQEELLHSQTHLIEIDLLRRGEHTGARPGRVLVPA